MSVSDPLESSLADRYRLERELGQGGMATVYLAADVRHQRRVAIKVLHQDIAAAMGAERFLKEIQLTAALQHPHILPLFDSGTAAGRVFYVMPFVEGETLRARLDRERQLPVADALRIAGEIASALEYAHKRGIVHRDIKPENILLQDGRVLVADFGIALAAAEAGGGARLTQTGISLGTPQYMSPEQAMGERSTDARTDLFALGAVTYEMLSGEPPFAGPTVQAIVSKVLTSQPVPVDELRRSVPEHAAAAIMAALEKLPADRPASAEQFAQMLAGTTAVPTGRTSGARTAPSPRSRGQRLLPWGAGIAAGLALGVGLMAWRGRGASATGATADTGPMRFIFAPTDSLQIQAVCCGRMFAIAPDGQSIVYQARAPLVDTTRIGPPAALYRRDLGSLAGVPLESTENATALSISPDGTQLAFVVGRELRRMPLRGGPVSTVATLPAGYVGGTDWRDAEHLLVAVQNVLYAATVKDGQLTPLTSSARFAEQVTGPSAVGNSGAVVFAFATIEDAPRVHYLAPGSKQAKPVMLGASPHFVPAWKALVVNREGRLLAYPFDPATGDTLGPGVRIAEGVPLRSPLFSHGEFDVAVNGTFALTRRQEGGDVGWVPSSRTVIREGGTSSILPLPLEKTVVFRAQFSPSGSSLLVAGFTTSTDGMLYVYDLRRRAYQRVSDEESVLSAAWTNRGDSIVYFPLNGRALKIRAADGTGSASVIAEVPGWSTISDLSVHDDIVVFSGRATASATSTDIGIVRRKGPTSVATFAASANDEEAPTLSPDGRWLAYTITENGKSSVFVSPFPNATSRTVASSNGGRGPVWSADGRTLSFVDDNGAFISLPFSPGAGSAPPTVGTPTELYRRGFVRYWTRSPDGSKILTIDPANLRRLQGLEVVVGFRPQF